MREKEFHVISTGVSIITNLKSKKKLYTDIGISEEDRWKEIMENPEEIRKVVQIVSADPMVMSAELNTFLRVVKDKDPSNISVFLFGTKTMSNELCRTAIQEYLKTKGYVLYSPQEVSGYFYEAKYYPEVAVSDFQKDLFTLVDILIYIAVKKKEEGFKVFFNPTGGLKMHVVATTIAGFITSSEVYYMNEEFNDVVFIPNLFYLPKGKELLLLKMLLQKEETTLEELIPSEASSCEVQEYKDGIQRLALYGLVRIKDNKIILTERGSIILDKIRELF
ncbi:MAG: putative CRISPR-associated protein [Brevinematia bacterium]